MVKDSPELTDVSADASNVDFFTGNKKGLINCKGLNIKGLIN